MIVFHKEAQHVFVSNGILDEIFVETISKDLFCSMSVHCIFGKDRRSGETEHLRIVKELHYPLMTVTEMASVTFVKYHHDTGMTYGFYLAAIPRLADGGVKFLYGRDYYL